MAVSVWKPLRKFARLRTVSRTDMALAILLGSSLGYLGLGAQPPAAEWGVLIADGKNFMTTAWWISIFPGIAIVLTGLGFSLLGDGLGGVARV